jgi:GNAT superfamily N-acetyltransferase
MTLRPLSEHDVEDILRIDEALTGGRRPEHWDARITYAIRRDAEGSWVAEEGGKVIGFVFADVRGEEFGFSQPTGWVEVLAVHPQQQRKDVATALVERVTERFRARGVKDVRTLVGEKHPELRQFFENQGFAAEPVVVYCKKI